ncbi:MAG: serine protease [Gammaproteobacteria bacterium]|nr:serine protease [Gammaproteobacteria bacterium]
MEDTLREAKNATVAIGHLDSPSGSPNAAASFSISSAGFLYAYTPPEFIQGKSEPDEQGNVYYWVHLWVVTCHHSIKNLSMPIVRLDSKSAGTAIYTIPANQWYAHPTEDVAVARLRLASADKPTASSLTKLEDTDIVTFNSSSVALRQQLATMGFYEYTPVAMIGFPIGRIEGGGKNYPVVRSGRIAQIQGYVDGDPEHKSFLVDGSAFPGNSGGPVVIPGGTRSPKGEKVLSSTVLVGMVANSKVRLWKDQQSGQSVTAENLDLTGVVTMEAVHETISQVLAAANAKTASQ